MASKKTRVVVVEAHSKHSNVENPNAILEYALDPVYNRPLAFNPHALAALEMNCFLHETGIPASRCFAIAARNRVHALKNVAAAYGANLRARDIEASPYVSYPLRAAEMAAGADGCVVAVLAIEETARQLGRRGLGFSAFHLSVVAPVNRDSQFLGSFGNDDADADRTWEWGPLGRGRFGE